MAFKVGDKVRIKPSFKFDTGELSVEEEEYRQKTVFTVDETNWLKRGRISLTADDLDRFYDENNKNHLVYRDKDGVFSLNKTFKESDLILAEEDKTYVPSKNQDVGEVYDKLYGILMR